MHAPTIVCPLQTSFGCALHDAPRRPSQLALTLVLHVPQPSRRVTADEEDEEEVDPAVLLAQKDDPCRGRDNLTAFGGMEPQRTCLASCVVASTYIGRSARTSVGRTSPITRPTGFHGPATSQLSLHPCQPLGPRSHMPCCPHPCPTSPGPCRQSSPHAIDQHGPCKERPTPRQ